MKNNPFVSETYISIWSKHFNASKRGVNFDFINNISFVKSKLLPLYINFGKNLTNGIPFSLAEDSPDDYKNKVFQINNIPSYYNIDPNIRNPNLGLKKVLQYGAHITRIADFSDLDHYMKTIFKSNTRSKFRRNINRLEACFDVEYAMYYGDMQKEEYDFVFSEFYNLFEKRYLDKDEPCGELNPVLWNYYTELVYPLILEKKASLFVIYCNKKPVGVTFSYHYGSILIEALTVFDIDYYRYNIGHTTIYKMLDWSFENGVTLFDYTEGDYDYKRRWSNDSYQRYIYLFYDKKSIKSKIIASFIVKYFNFKRTLRDKNIIKKVLKFKHKTKTLFKKKEPVIVPCKVELLNKEAALTENLVSVDINEKKYSSQRKAIFDFLYMNPEPAKEFKLFTINESTKEFIAKGSVNTLKLSLDDK